MAYRDPTFNANILTDLLSTYLQQKSNERDRYFKAEQQARKANQPVIRSVGSNLVSVDPVTQQTEVIYQGPQKVTTPKLTRVEDEQGRVTLQPETAGLQTKPARVSANQNITPFRREVTDIANQNIKRLNKMKEPKQSPISGQLLSAAEQEKFYGESEKKEMEYWKSIRKNAKQYANQYAESGILPVYEEGASVPYVPSSQVEKKNFFEVYNVSE
jgi:hypothetical protein